MRVTSNTYTNLVINSSQSQQMQLATLQQEISSGDSVQSASDNPLAFQQASELQESLTQLNAYNSAGASATTQATANNSAMSSLHQLVAQASELATGVTSLDTPADMQATATQIQALISQVISTANQKSSDGTYLFGGTSNQPPIDTATQAYNTATNGDTTSVEVQAGNSVQTSIIAGRSTGTPPVSGFMYNATTGVDVLGALQQTVTDLNSGNATAVQSTDLTALNSALDNISQYVGSTAATMSAISTATDANSAQISSQDNELNGLTQTNLPNASLQLQQIQMQYEASLSAGTRLMSMSILNYISSVPST